MQGVKCVLLGSKWVAVLTAGLALAQKRKDLIHLIRTYGRWGFVLRYNEKHYQARSQQHPFEINRYTVHDSTFPIDVFAACLLVSLHCKQAVPNANT